MRKAKGALRASGVAVATVVVLTGCLQNPDAGGGGAGGTGGTVVDGGSADGDKKVTLLGAFGGDEEKRFNASLADFEKQSGIDVQYTADQDFTTTVKQKVQAGDSPDIAMFPQPGGLLEFAAQNKIQPIDTYLDYDKLDGTLLPGLLDAAKYKGRVYGAPMRNAVKSLIWYPKKAYDAGGYSKEPKSWQDLTTNIAGKIKAAGIAPWCMGWESAQATGWVGTDWIEELVLKMYGPDVYEDWIYHRIPFNDPRIVKAFDEFAKVAKTPGQVLGDAKGILSTAFANAMTPAFGPSPKCMIMKQGNFAITFFPKNIAANLDTEVGTYLVPPFEGGFAGNALLGGGDIAALFNGNDPDARKVMEFLTSDKFGGPWAKAGGWLSPHKTFDLANYPDETTRNIAKLANEADSIVFDGSDVMPKAVGSGTFWTEMVKWENGQSSQQTADNIEASWPKS